MRDHVLNFAKQFEYSPVIENRTNFKGASSFLVAGMGGSHLAADLLAIWDPRLDLVIHKDYGLPPLMDLTNRLFIAISYSGNTEETLDAYQEAVNEGLNTIAISTGGKLLSLAEENSQPYIKLPESNLQPRLATGMILKALLVAIAKDEAVSELTKLAESLKPQNFEQAGQELAKNLYESVPIIYSSARNFALANNWKIKFNETGKIPAFANAIPELNHNEMTGFDVQDKTRELSKKFHFVFLSDKSDHPKIQKRMTVLKTLFESRGLRVSVVKLEGGSVFKKIFASLILGDWTSYYTAIQYGVEPEQVPMVEEFKKLIA
ncbi:MAG: bifunctional phosphoglucose/phosphomannose isomerase [bacterium]|nr:bifunctional phosphoglucose/phosphomannose isomerase [bacterium]